MAVSQEPSAPSPVLPFRRKKTPKPRPDHCLNCGQPADGNFCARCGQENKEHTVALGPLIQDLLAEMASWDSKLLRTLVPLLIRPGFLTNEYNAGRRISYLSPLKVYLTVSVLFFLALAWKNPLAGNIQLGIVRTQTGHGTMIINNGRPEPVPHSAAEYDATQQRRPPAERDPPIARLLVHRLIRAGQNPQTFFNALLGDIPKMMFFLLPAFAVSLKLLYWRARRLYVEHLIFLLHVHAFTFLLLTPLLLTQPDWLIVGVSLALLCLCPRRHARGLQAKLGQNAG